MKLKFLLVTMVVLLLAGSLFADSDPTFTIYTNYAQWLAATTGWAHYPFCPSGISAVPCPINAVNESQNPGTSVISTAGSFGAPRGVFVGPYTQVWTDRVTNAFAETTTWWITGKDMQAFGGYWDFSPGGWGQGLTLTISLIPIGSQHIQDICGDVVNGCVGGPTQTTLVPDGSWFGIVANSTFSAFTISADHQAGVAETFDLAGLDLARTPEPGTLLMLGTGVIGLAGALRRRMHL